MSGDIISLKVAASVGISRQAHRQILSGQFEASLKLAVTYRLIGALKET
jgi:DNA-binding XRE family transcriptional regulator